MSEYEPYYVVRNGNICFTFREWPSVQATLVWMKDAEYKQFATLQEVQYHLFNLYNTAMQTASPATLSPVRNEAAATPSLIAPAPTPAADRPPLLSTSYLNTCYISSYCVDDRAGYAFVLAGREHYGPVPVQAPTKPYSELYALMMALGQIMGLEQQDITIYGLSNYAVNATTTWHRGWRENGWMTKDGKPVMYSELIMRIADILTNSRVKLISAEQGPVNTNVARSLYMTAQRGSYSQQDVVGPSSVSTA